jgi:RNA polymerase sigma factor for flagellar operon FliA
MSLKDPKNQRLLNDFISEHAPLINKQINILKAKGKIPSNVEHEDLHYAGLHGLMSALDKYDHSVAQHTSSGKENENPFTKYAETRIQGKMLDHISSQDEVPRQARERAKNLAILNKPKITPETPE